MERNDEGTGNRILYGPIKIRFRSDGIRLPQPVKTLNQFHIISQIKFTDKNDDHPKTKTRSIVLTETMMSHEKRIISLFFLIFQLSASWAFSVVRHSKPSVSMTKTFSALYVGAVYSDDDESNLFLNECLNSERCELEEAQMCLDHLSEITLDDLTSNNASAITGAIEKLRQKIEITQQIQSAALYQRMSNAMNVIAVAYVVWAIFHDIGGSELSVDNSVMSYIDAYSISLYF